VLVRQQPDANNGDIVIALMDDSATVKTFFRDNNKIRLQPANPAFKPIIVDDCDVLGKVIGLYRRY
jgi:repressor LexA